MDRASCEDICLAQVLCTAYQWNGVSGTVGCYVHTSSLVGAGMGNTNAGCYVKPTPAPPTPASSPAPFLPPTQGTADYVLTSDRYAGTADHASACVNEFGASYRVAD